jgi:hypothetical protein
MKKGAIDKKIIICTIFVVIIIVILGIFIIGKSDKTDISNSNQIASSQSSSSVTSVTSPKDVYLKFHKEIDNAKNFDDYISIMKKYSSSDLTNKLSQYESFTPDLKSTSYALLKASMPKASDFKDIKETVNGDTATLVITTLNPKQLGNAALKKENGAWKISADEWNANA